MANTKATLIAREDYVPDAKPPETPPPAPEAKPDEGKTEEVTATVTPEEPLIALHERPFHDLTADEQVQAFVEKVMIQRAEADKPPPPPAPRSARQISQTEAEMARGKEALAHHAERMIEQLRTAKPAKVDLSQGTNTPIFRPEDYVPNMNQGKAVAGTTQKV